VTNRHSDMIHANNRLLLLAKAEVHPNSNKKYQTDLGRGCDATNCPWLQWGAPDLTPKLSLSIYRFPNPTTCLIPGPIRPTIPNLISHFATMHQTDTHRQTKRRLEGMFDDYWPLLLYRERCGLIIISLKHNRFGSLNFTSSQLLTKVLPRCAKKSVSVAGVVSLTSCE